MDDTSTVGIVLIFTCVASDENVINEVTSGEFALSHSSNSSVEGIDRKEDNTEHKCLCLTRTVCDANNARCDQFIEKQKKMVNVSSFPVWWTPKVF